MGLAEWRLPVRGPDAVCLAAHLGAEGIQLDLGGPGRAPWLDETTRLIRVRNQLADSGVVPLAVSVNVLNDIGLTAEQGTAAAEQVRCVILRALNVAVKLDVRLVFLPSFRRSAIDSPLALARTIDVLRWACSEACARELLLATENVLAPQQLRQLIEHVDSPHLRVVLDTGNLSTVGLDPVAILQAAAPVLACQVHIKKTNDQMPLSVEDAAVLDTLVELHRIHLAVEALVLENDYREGTLARVSADLNWLRNSVGAYPIHQSGANLPA